MDKAGPSVAEVGEIELVARLLAILEHTSGGAGDDLLVGPGDDAAVLACHGAAALTTDSQQQDVHFRLDWIDPEVLGRRAIAVNASDLGAMGARPCAFLAALALPASTQVSWVERLARGMREGAERFDAAVIGGDVAGSSEKISVTVTAVGVCDEGSTPARRDGARSGDRIYVTGYPGRAGAGLYLLEAGCRLDASSEAADRSGASEQRESRSAEPPATSPTTEVARAEETCLRAFLDPRPPVSFGVAVVRDRRVGAMMDVSDGLGADLARMCRASATGAVLDAAELLVDPVLRAVAAKFGIDARACVLGGGEDYELLCAVPAVDEDGFRGVAAAAGVVARPIGTFVDGQPRVSIDEDGRRTPLVAGGWDHFSPWR